MAAYSEDIVSVKIIHSFVFACEIECSRNESMDNIIDGVIARMRVWWDVPDDVDMGVIALNRPGFSEQIFKGEGHTLNYFERIRGVHQDIFELIMSAEAFDIYNEYNNNHPVSMSSTRTNDIQIQVRITERGDRGWEMISVHVGKRDNNVTILQVAEVALRKAYTRSTRGIDKWKNREIVEVGYHPRRVGESDTDYTTTSLNKKLVDVQRRRGIISSNIVIDAVAELGG
jgi:hypothetical protein